MIYDEKALIDSFEQGEWKSVADFESIKKRMMQAATETALKDTRINPPGKA